MKSNQVSKRGPFDITTGPRDGRPKKKSELGPGHYEYTPFTDKLQKGSQKKHGKFGALKCNAKPGERIFYSTIRWGASATVILTTIYKYVMMLVTFEWIKSVTKILL